MYPSMKPKIVLLIFVMSITLSVSSQTHLPSFFSDNMVLQQEQEVAIWGTDQPGTPISVEASWGKEAKTEANDQGGWKVNLKTGPADGLEYSIKVSGSDVVELKRVVLGEVWLASGQSNMEMWLGGFFNQPVLGGNEAILNSKNSQIRFFTVQNNSSDTPLDDVNGSWLLSDPSTSRDFSAAAYFFAHKLEQVLDVPIGIISSSWGGSKIESWMDSEMLAPYEDFTYTKTPDDAKPNHTPYLLYNAMIHPFLGYNIKGVLWYQGESNWNEPEEYRELFPKMINSWRDRWELGTFPFYFVQVAPIHRDNINTAFLREAQLKSMQVVENTGMAVVLDIGEEWNIHPGEKQKVGERLAYWALAKDYGMDAIACNGPVYREMKNDTEGGITLYFDSCPNGINTFGAPLTGFEIAGEDRVFYKAEAKIPWGTSTILVQSKDVKNPVAVRYCFNNWVIGSLYNIEGLPASSFRTDDWER